MPVTVSSSAYWFSRLSEGVVVRARVFSVGENLFYVSYRAPRLLLDAKEKPLEDRAARILVTAREHEAID
jgi:hypothetical protein